MVEKSLEHRVGARLPVIGVEVVAVVGRGVAGQQLVASLGELKVLAVILRDRFVGLAGEVQQAQDLVAERIVEVLVVGEDRGDVAAGELAVAFGGFGVDGLELDAGDDRGVDDLGEVVGGARAGGDGDRRADHGKDQHEERGPGEVASAQEVLPPGLGAGHGTTHVTPAGGLTFTGGHRGGSACQGGVGRRRSGRHEKGHRKGVRGEDSPVLIGDLIAASAHLCYRS